MIKTINNRSGQALIIILMICLFLGLLCSVIWNLQSSQINLLSKTARDYIALSVAESGLHCVLAEMKADYQFVTHGNHYIPAKPNDWPSPSERKYNYLKSSKLLKLSGNKKGVYEGSVEFPTLRLKGDFKVRMKLIKSQNSVKSKSLDEAHCYFLLESYGKVGDSYRKISTVIEKFTPGNFLLYDGQILDVGGYGPYRVNRGLINAGRLYGHEMIVFSKKGAIDSTADLRSNEKISTPGYIKAETPVSATFFDHKKIEIISPKNDSTDPDKFKTFSKEEDKDPYMLDGNHGAKPQLLPPLNPSYYREAKKPHPEILKEGSKFEGFSESKWRNPEKPNEKVYDLFFGWKYRKEEKDFLIYSEVPLRIWGCPRWTALTIFCEKDVYIAGDFNANPDAPQEHSNGLRAYSKPVKNGSAKNGCQILSMGRIWFDYSNPMNFLRNEMEMVIDYDLACTLHREEPKEAVLLKCVWPPRSVNIGPVTLRAPFSMVDFSSVNALAHLPKGGDVRIDVLIGLGTGAIHPALAKLRAYLNEPGAIESKIDDSSTVGNVVSTITGVKQGSLQEAHFPIKNKLLRYSIIQTIAEEARKAGMVEILAREGIIALMIKDLEKEMKAEKPDGKLAIWNIADRMYALKQKHKLSGLRYPEMTVNALLVDSAELNAKWDFGNSQSKINNELGNVDNEAMRSFVWAKDKNTRMILRHYGSMIHLRNRPVKEYIKGSFVNAQPIIRQISFDNTYATGGGKYFPPYPMAGFTLINWQDEFSSEEEFKSVK